MKLEKNRVYKRKKWEEHWAFAWSYKYNYFAYIDLDKTKNKGEIIFRYNNKPKYSKVGDSVLESDDIIEINLNLNGDNMETNVNYIGYGYNVVLVQSQEGRRQFYAKIDKSIFITISDLVVVETINGLIIAVVDEIVENNTVNAKNINKAKCWVVDKIDYTQQQIRKDLTKKREYIIAKLEERKQAVKAINIYEMLAKTDIIAAKLLQELKSIDIAIQ